MKLSNLVRKFNKEKLNSAFDEVMIPEDAVVETGITPEGGITSLVDSMKDEIAEGNRERAHSQMTEEAREAAEKEQKKIKRGYTLEMLFHGGASFLSLMNGVATEDPMFMLMATVPAAGAYLCKRIEPERLADPEGFEKKHRFSEAARRVALATSLLIMSYTMVDMGKGKHSDEPGNSAEVSTMAVDGVRLQDKDYYNLIKDAEERKDWKEADRLLAEAQKFSDDIAEMKGQVSRSDHILGYHGYPADYTVAGKTHISSFSNEHIKAEPGSRISIKVAPKSVATVVKEYKMSGHFDLYLENALKFPSYLPRLDELTTRVFVEGWEDRAVLLPGDKESDVLFSLPEDIEAGAYRMVIETYPEDTEKYSYIGPVQRKIFPLVIGDVSMEKLIFIATFGGDSDNNIDVNLDYLLKEHMIKKTWTINTIGDDGNAVIEEIRRDEVLSTADISERDGVWERFSIPELGVSYYTTTSFNRFNNKMFGAFNNYILDFMKLNDGDGNTDFMDDLLIRLDLEDANGEAFSHAQRYFSIHFWNDGNQYSFDNVIGPAPANTHEHADPQEKHIFADLWPGSRYLIDIEGKRHELSWDLEKGPMLGGFTLGDQPIDIDITSNRMQAQVRVGKRDIGVTCRQLGILSYGDEEDIVIQPGVTLYLNYGGEQ
jgi:hypothetical protein